MLQVTDQLGSIQGFPLHANQVLYLRNKETQQIFQVIVNIQYDAGFSANDIYS